MYFVLLFSSYSFTLRNKIIATEGRRGTYVEVLLFGYIILFLDTVEIIAKAELKNIPTCFMMFKEMWIHAV